MLRCIAQAAQRTKIGGWGELGGCSTSATGKSFRFVCVVRSYVRTLRGLAAVWLPRQSLVESDLKFRGSTLSPFPFPFGRRWLGLFLFGPGSVGHWVVPAGSFPFSKGPFPFWSGGAFPVPFTVPSPPPKLLSNFSWTW